MKFNKAIDRRIILFSNIQVENLYLANLFMFCVREDCLKEFMLWVLNKNIIKIFFIFSMLFEV